MKDGLAVSQQLTMQAPLKRRGAKHLRVAGLATLMAIPLAFVTHGSFWEMKWALGGLVFAALGLTAVGVLLRLAVRRRPGFGSMALYLALAAVLAVPGVLLAGRGVFVIERWNLERYVRMRLAPSLEAVKSSAGAYPESLASGGIDPQGIPWLLETGTYSSDGTSYTIFYHDPFVCSRTFSYSSASHSWSRSRVDCWY